MPRKRKKKRVRAARVAPTRASTDSRRNFLRAIPAALVGLPLVAVSPANALTVARPSPAWLHSATVGEATPRLIDIPDFAHYRYDTWARYAVNLMHSKLDRTIAKRLTFERVPSKAHDFAFFDDDPRASAQFDWRCAQVDLRGPVESQLPYLRFLEEYIRPGALQFASELNLRGANADRIITRPLAPVENLGPRTPMVYFDQSGLCVSASIVEKRSGVYQGTLDMLLAMRFKT